MADFTSKWSVWNFPSQQSAGWQLYCFASVYNLDGTSYVYKYLMQLPRALPITHLKFHAIRKNVFSLTCFKISWWSRPWTMLRAWQMTERTANCIRPRENRESQHSCNQGTLWSWRHQVSRFSWIQPQKLSLVCFPGASKTRYIGVVVLFEQIIFAECNWTPCYVVNMLS